jgi:hypothetical protein
VNRSSLAIRRRAVVIAFALLAAGGCGSSGGSAAPSSEAGTTDVTAAETATTATSTDADLDDGDTAGAGDIEQTCAELQVVQDFSAEITEATNGILVDVASGAQVSEEETIAAFIGLAERIEDLLPDLLAAYERAAAVAPPDIATEIRAVADGTAVLTPELVEAYSGIESADDLADLEAIFSTTEMQEAATSAGISSLRLDNFTNPNCGFQFSNR